MILGLLLYALGGLAIFVLVYQFAPEISPEDRRWSAFWAGLGWPAIAFEIVVRAVMGRL